MLLATSTTDKIQAITSATANIDAHVSYVDNNGGAITPGRVNTLISSIATTDLHAVTSSSAIQRNFQTIILRNSHATASNDVTVRHTDGTTTVTLFKATLAAGETMQYVDGDGWSVFDASGARKMTAAGSGVYLGTTIASGVLFTTGKRTNTIFVRMVAGGGGGAGCTSVAAAASAGGGGGAGGYAEKTFAVTPNTGYTIQIGAAGNGASGALGGTGTDSTIAVGATTVTAKAGVGAAVATAVGTLTAYPGGAGGAVSTNGDVNSSGQPGDYGVTLIVATPIIAAGSGGSGPFGAGGRNITAVGNGNNAVGFGAGGGGSATGASTVRTGGNGTAGLIIIDEYA